MVDVDLSSLKALTDLRQVERQVGELQAAEERTDALLDRLLDDRTAALARDLDALDAIHPKLSVLLNDMQQLVGTIESTSQLAESTSAKVRQLDVEQSRVKEAMDQVSAIQELKSCIDGVQEAMKLENYERAAALVHRYLTFNPKIVKLVFDESDDAHRILRDAELELKRIVVQEFDKAVKANDEAATGRYFKLFPLLLMTEEGLSKYSDYVAGLVAQRAEMESLSVSGSIGDRKKAALFVDLLTKLYESIVLMIEKHEPIVETHAPGKAIFFVQRLQNECDVQAKKIIHVFYDTFGVRLLLEKTRQQGSTKVLPASATVGAVDRLDPLNIDPILQEMVHLSQRTELYFQFVRSHVDAQLSSLSAEDETDEKRQQQIAHLKSRGANGWLRTTQLSQMFQELLGNYISLEDFFLRKSIQKAMKMDEYEPGSLTSSCVDDAFYILKKCVTRSLISLDLDTFCAVVNILCRSLDDEYLPVLQEKMHMLNATASSDIGSYRVGFMIMLNNLEVSGDYVMRLKQDVEEQVGKIFTDITSNQLGKIASCLSQLNDAKNSFLSLLDASVTQLFNQSWKATLKAMLQDCLKDAKYVFTEEEYESAEGQSFVGRFLVDFKKSAVVYSQHSTEGNYGRIVQLVVQFVCEEVEKVVLKTKFNQLGALKLDKDIRALSSSLSSLTQRTTRDKFARLSQISTLLNVDKISEVYDYVADNRSVSSGGLAWWLPISEVKNVLALRVEFRREDIQRLKLA